MAGFEFCDADEAGGSCCGGATGACWMLQRGRVLGRCSERCMGRVKGHGYAVTVAVTCAGCANHAQLQQGLCGAACGRVRCRVAHFDGAHELVQNNMQHSDTTCAHEM